VERKITSSFNYVNVIPFINSTLNLGASCLMLAPSLVTEINFLCLNWALWLAWLAKREVAQTYRGCHLSST